MLLRKSESSLEKKNSFTEGTCSSEWKSSKKMESLQDKSVIQNSAIKGYHEFHVNSPKDLEMLILPTPMLLLTSLIF